MSIFIGIVLLVGIILLLSSITETHLLNITEDRLSEDGSCELKVLFFSDLHMSFCFISVSRIIAAIKANRPDVIVFGGDAINSSRAQDKKKAIDYLSQISNFCKEEGIILLGVTGNHDYKDGFNSACFNEAGIELLDGKNKIIHKDDRSYMFTGIADSGRARRIWYEIPKGEEHTDKRILIVHNPDYILNMTYAENADQKVDYVLSGHIHGGQIRTPFKIEFNKLRSDVLPKRGIISGKHKVNDTVLFISKGLGCILLPLRLGAVPEINIIYL